MAANEYPPEIATKQKRVAEFLDRRGLDGVLLWHRANFAWITGGKDNHIPGSSPIGVAAIYATRDRLTCLTNNIEGPRIEAEELAGTGIGIVDCAWYDAAAMRRVFRDVIAGKVAADTDESGLGLPPLPVDFTELRWQLCPEEIDRYREGGRRASAAMEKAARQLRAGMSEFDAAGILEHEMLAAGLTPMVNLVASDERIEEFRHPIPTAKQIERMVMLVSCAAYGGLISNLTRFVSFGRSVAGERSMALAACGLIELAAIRATRVGRTLGEVFADIQAAYARAGAADQWRSMHQGGSTGYAPREKLATPGSTIKILENQAFAWNPSLPGAKSEDTFLCTSQGQEILTKPSELWPCAMTDLPARRPLPLEL